MSGEAFICGLILCFILSFPFALLTWAVWNLLVIRMVTFAIPIDYWIAYWVTLIYMPSSIKKMLKDD